MDQALWGERATFIPPLNKSHRPQESRLWNNGAGSSLLAQLNILSASSIWYDGAKCALLGTGKALRFKATLPLQKQVLLSQVRIVLMDSVLRTLHKYAFRRPAA